MIKHTLDRCLAMTATAVSRCYAGKCDVTDTTSAILDSLRAEMERQEEIHGSDSHQPLYWHAILGEEMGEVARALVEYNLAACRQELIQVAASAIAFALTLDIDEAYKE